MEKNRTNPRARSRLKRRLSESQDLLWCDVVNLVLLLIEQRLQHQNHSVRVTEL